jgi:hypothetical protein
MTGRDEALIHALRRAAQRVPGRTSANSLAKIPAHHTMTAGLDPATIPLPDLAPRPGPLRLAPGEAWCTHCGESVNELGYCARCGSQRSRPVAQIIASNEYYIAS